MLVNFIAAKGLIRVIYHNFEFVPPVLSLFRDSRSISRSKFCDRLDSPIPDPRYEDLGEGTD